VKVAPRAMAFVLSVRGSDLAAKIRWRKRFDRRPLLVTLQDKFAVRNYAADRGMATAPLLYYTDRPESIPFEELPAEYMIKAAHGSGWNILCWRGQHYLFGDGRECAELIRCPESPTALPTPMTRSDVIATCREWLERRYNDSEWAYSQMDPRILIEELLRPPPGEDLMDYRLYTFDGVVRAVNVGSSTFRRDGVNAFLDGSWRPIGLSRYREALPATLPAKPVHWDDMVAAARRLGRGVDFVRIDMYDTAAGCVLGEMTVYPQSGCRATPTSCVHFNRWLGDQWQLQRRQQRQAVVWNVVTFVPDILCRVAARASKTLTGPSGTRKLRHEPTR
jgi:hypothetical protein